MDDLWRLEFFTGGALVLQPGDPVAHGDIVFGQPLEASIILHILFDWDGLVLRDALGKLLAVEEPLENVLRTAGSGLPRRVGFKELLAQRAAAETVKGRHLFDQSLRS